MLPEMCTQDTLLVAVQPQSLTVVTLTVPLPPSDVNKPLVGEIVKLHGMPSWFTMKVWPAIVSVPAARGMLLGLAATV